MSENIETIPSNYKIIQLGNIGTGEFRDEKFKYISQATFDELNCKKVDSGCLLFNRMLDNGKFNCCVLDSRGDYVTSVDVMVIKPNDNVDLVYLKNALLSYQIQKQLIQLSSGSGRVRITKTNILNKVNFKMHEIESQKKIGKILSSIDDLIDQSIELETLYLQQKKSLLQIIFNNNIYPLTILEKEFKFFNGKAYENEMDENGEYEIISLNSINIDGQINDILNRLNTNDAKLDAGDLVMILSDVAHGYFLGVTAIIPEGNKYVLNQRVGGLKPIDKYSSSFARHYINHNQKYFKHIGQGTSQKNINKPDILKFKIPDIDMEEQNKISSLLTSIDELANYQKNITNEYKELKKYYLNIIFK